MYSYLEECRGVYTVFSLSWREPLDLCYAQVTHSRTGHRISHGCNPASFVAIRIGPSLSVLHRNHT